MIVILLEKVPASLRGELSRWLLEPKTGTFVGRVSAIVRDRLWQKCLDVIGPDSGGVLVHQTDNEQGFTIRTAGDTSRKVVDFEGILLVQTPHADPAKARKKMRLGKSEHTPKSGDIPFIRDRVVSPLQSPNLYPEPSTDTGTEPNSDTEDEDEEDLDIPYWQLWRNKPTDPQEEDPKDT